MKHLLIGIAFILISQAAKSQSRTDLIGEWEFRKFVSYKSGNDRKKIVSKKEWSPKILKLNDDGSFISTEISYTDENEETGQGKWSEATSQLTLDYYYKDGSLQSKGEPVYVSKVTKSKLILVYSSNARGQSDSDSKWGKTFVTYRRRK